MKMSSFNSYIPTQINPLTNGPVAPMVSESQALYSTELVAVKGLLYRFAGKPSMLPTSNTVLCSRFCVHVLLSSASVSSGFMALYKCCIIFKFLR